MTFQLPDPLVVKHVDEPVSGEDRGRVVSPWSVQRNFEALALAFTDLRGLLFWGSGSPETVVTASPPALYLNMGGGAGTTLYVKESGSNTNTGWRAV